MRLYFKSPSDDFNFATGILNGLIYASVFWIAVAILIISFAEKIGTACENRPQVQCWQPGKGMPGADTTSVIKTRSNLTPQRFCAASTSEV